MTLHTWHPPGSCANWSVFAGFVAICANREAACNRSMHLINPEIPPNSPVFTRFESGIWLHTEFSTSHANNILSVSCPQKVVADEGPRIFVVRRRFNLLFVACRRPPNQQIHDALVRHTPPLPAPAQACAAHVHPHCPRFRQRHPTALSSVNTTPKQQQRHQNLVDHQSTVAKAALRGAVLRL